MYMEAQKAFIAAHVQQLYLCVAKTASGCRSLELPLQLRYSSGAHSSVTSLFGLVTAPSIRHLPGRSARGLFPRNRLCVLGRAMVGQELGPCFPVVSRGVLLKNLAAFEHAQSMQMSWSPVHS